MTGLHLHRIRLFLSVVALGGLGLGTTVAVAQGPAPPAVLTDANGYKYFAPYVDPSLKPIDAAKERGKIRTAENLVRRVLSGEVPLAGNKTQFDFYYVRMLLPEFTQTTDAALKVLPIERQKFMTNHLMACDVPAVHKYLVDLTFAQMKDIVQDNFHPACRYNAMLIISGLNSVDAIAVGPNKTTPEPLIDALPFILEQYQKVDNSDAIRVAALLGMVRHLEWDNYRGPTAPYVPVIAPPLRDAIVKELLALAAATEPPAGREVEGHEWFRRRAIEGLTHANLNQVDPAVAAVFEKLLMDESESLAIRCAAAAAIGKVVYRDPVKLAPTPTAKELGYLALVACDKELTRVANLNKEEDDKLMRMSGGSGGYGYGGSGGEGGLGGMNMGGRGGRGVRGGSGESGYPGSGSGRGGRGGRSGPGGISAMPGGMTGKSGRTSYPGGSMDMGGAEGGYATAIPEDPKQYRFELVRRRLRAQLYAVEIGFGGPDANLKAGGSSLKPMDPAVNTGPPRGVEAIARGTPDEKPVKDISDLVGKLVTAVEGADTDMAALEKELRKQMKPLEGKTRKVAAVVAPVETPTDEPQAPAPPPGKPAAGKPAPGAPANVAPAAAPADAPAPPAPAAPAAGVPAPGVPAAGVPAPAPAAPAPAAPAAAATPAR